jgi:hypothetical protein
LFLPESFALTSLDKNMNKLHSTKVNDIAWICLKKELFHTDNDMYLAMAYISPANSTYTKQLNYNPFDIIEDEIAKYSSKGQVVLMGDLNSRTSTVTDFIESDNANHIPMSFSFTENCKYVARSSQDTKISTCSFGKQLIDLCISASLKIVNGRMLGDPNGRYTCHKYNGSSVVDYIIADHTTFSQIRYLKVHDLQGSLSDHCMVSFGLAVSVSTTIPSNGKERLKNVPTKFKWDDNIRSAKFIKILGSESNLKKLNGLEADLRQNAPQINETVQRLNEVLTNTADVSLKKVNHSLLKHNKRWYNNTCSSLRTQINSLVKHLSTDPQNSYLRGLFFTTKKQYKKTMKQTKYIYKQRLSEKLEFASENDPKTYWKLLEALKHSENDNKTSGSPISPDEWHTHFETLFKQHPPNNSVHEAQILRELEQRENEKVFNELSFQITSDEIKVAAKHLKAGKASGPDSLSNEIIKASLKFTLPLLTKLFNNILTSGNYPQCWTEGIITALHKNDTETSPDSYCGITISSCLGKLFCTVLNNRLKEFCDKNSIINERQSGFRKHARTSNNIFIIRTLHEKYCLQGNQKLYACFIDFQKAFDSIWHEALLLKLLRVGIGGPFYKVIKSIYENVTASVRCGNKLSNNFAIHRGVKQGDIMSPLLFNIFVNDMISLFSHYDCDAPSLLQKEV